MTQKISVLLADDHAVLRQSLRALLEMNEDIVVIGEAGDGREAVALVDQLKPSVVLMDLAMPIMDGIEATRQIIKKHPDIRVLALTAHESEEYLFQFLDAGGTGLMVKKTGFHDLVAAIKSVHCEGAFLSPSMVSALVKDFTLRGQNRGKDWNADLTLKESEVLMLIAEGDTNDEIAAKLNRSVKIIETHRMNLMEKLDLHNRGEILRYAIRHGLIEA